MAADSVDRHAAIRLFRKQIVVVVPLEMVSVSRDRNRIVESDFPFQKFLYHLGFLFKIFPDFDS